MNALELKIPPPIVMTLTAAAMWLVAYAIPTVTASWPLQWLIALVLAITGIGLAIQGARSFRRASTTVNPLKPETTSNLVTSGIYRFTRNPMYLGMSILLTGWAVFLGNLVALLGVPVFMLYIGRFQIAPEERVLAKLFGKEFSDYQQQVRRWL